MKILSTTMIGDKETAVSFEFLLEDVKLQCNGFITQKGYFYFAKDETENIAEVLGRKVLNVLTNENKNKRILQLEAELKRLKGS